MAKLSLARAILCSSFYLTSVATSPAEAQDNFLGAVGTKAFKTSELRLHKNAVSLNDYNIRLTSAANRQAGSAELPQICAKEYKVRFDLQAGSDLSSAGGAGFYIFRTREARHESDGTWGEWFPAKKTLAGLPNRLDLLHFDTWRDWLNINGQTVYQRDGNSIYYWSFEGGHQDVLGLNALLNQPMPFPMEGSEWFNVTMHFKNNKLTIEVRRAGSLVMSRTVDSYYEEKVLHSIVISAWTGASQNLQSVRNISFEGIVPDDCAGPMNDAQLQNQLTTACGPLSSGVCPEVCVKATALSLFLQGKLDIELYESAVRSCQNNVCVSSTSTAFNNGYSSGYTSGYAAGISSVDVEVIKTTSFNEGYQAGFSQGHIAGFKDGAASRDKDVADALQEGKSSCLADAKVREDAAYLKGLLTKKVTICHVEPKKNPVTLTISTSALEAHLKKHGDKLGACPANANKPK